MKTKRTALFGLVLSLFMCSAQAQNWEHSAARIWIQDTVLCPGEVADLGIFVSLGATASGKIDALQNFMFYLEVVDTSALTIETYNWDHQAGSGYDYYMGQPVITDMQPELMRGSFTSNYVEGKMNSSYMKPQRGTFMCIWTGPLTPTFIPDPSKPFFRIRVRCKAQKTSKMVIPVDNLAFSKGLGNNYCWFDFRDPQHGYIGAGTVGSRPGPDKKKVSAGKDTVLCAGSHINLNATGGSSYLWSQAWNPDVDGVGYQDDNCLKGANTANPTFTPLKGGKYTFQVQVFDTFGCYTRDTVICDVGPRMFADYGLTPEWSYVDSEQTVLFTVACTHNGEGHPPVHVTLSPESAFAPGQSVFDLTYGDPARLVSTMPVVDPFLVSAHLEDDWHCFLDLSSSVFIKGLDISGYLNPFPVYRCGTESSDKSVQLNVITRGGSGKFGYTWHVKDLEYGEAGDPVISNPYIRSPRLTYKGLCEVSVDIYDMITFQTVTIRDTMEYRDWIHPQVNIVLDTLRTEEAMGGQLHTMCENSEFYYRAVPTFGGDSTVYEWRVNGLLRERVTALNGEDCVWGGFMRRGDKVDVIMYSNEDCIADIAVPSNQLTPDITYPNLMSIWASNVSDGEYLDYCKDSMQLSVIYRNAGNNFKLEWYRNNAHVNGLAALYSDYVNVGRADSGAYVLTLPRTGYYDAYTAVVSHSDMPCSINGTAETDAMYLNWVSDDDNRLTGSGAGTDLSPIENPTRFYAQHPTHVMEPQPIHMDRAAVCGMDKITVTTDVLYLPRDFALVWFKKDGTDSIPLGWYGYMQGNENVPDALNELNVSVKGAVDMSYLDLRWDENDYGYGYGKNQVGVRNMLRDGFKLVLNDPNGGEDVSIRMPKYIEGVETPNPSPWKAGDTLFYRVYDLSGSCCSQPYSVRSQYYVPEILGGEDYGTAQLNIKGLKICNGTTLTLTASMTGLPDNVKNLVRYEWIAYGQEVSDPKENYSRYFVISGEKHDTMRCIMAYPHIVISCRAVLDIDCGTGFPKETEIKFADWIMGEMPYYVTHSRDTVICEGAEVQPWVKANFYDGRTVIDVSGSVSKSAAKKAAKRAAKAESQVVYTWSTSLQELVNSVSGPHTVATGASLTYKPVSNGAAPTGKGDKNDHKGITKLYVRTSMPEAECVRYDSVMITMAHSYPTHITGIEMLHPMPWCDSLTYDDEDPNVLFGDEPYIKGGQYAMGYTNCTNLNLVDFMWNMNDELGGFTPHYDTISVSGALNEGDRLWLIVRNNQLTCLPNTDTAELIIHNVKKFEVVSAYPEKAVPGQTVELLTDAQDIRTGNGVKNMYFDWYVQEENGSWKQLKKDSYVADCFEDADVLNTTVPQHGATYKVVAHDRNHVCPDAVEIHTIPLAVKTGVQLNLRDVNDNRRIECICVNSEHYVYSEDQIYFTAAPVTTYDAYLDADVENPGADGYVMYYKNGQVAAAQHKGSSAVNRHLVSAVFPVLGRNQRYRITLKEDDVYDVVYFSDTVPLDGKATHSSHLVVYRSDGNGDIKIVSDKEVVCPGENVKLEAVYSWPENKPVAPVISWEPSDLVTGTGAYTANGTVTRETLFKVHVVDTFGCPGTDSIYIYHSQKGLTVPFTLSVQSTAICGEEAEVEVTAKLPGSNSASSMFKQIYYYVADASGRLQSVDSGYIAPRVKVKDGWKVYATSKINVECNYLLSYSDTLTFRSVAKPEIKRISPVNDTIVCSGNLVNVEFSLTGAPALEWNTALAPASVADMTAALQRRYRVDRNAVLTVSAVSPELSTCTATNTVVLSGMGYEEIRPSLQVSVNKNWVCGEGEEVTYTLASEYCDEVIWYRNGKEWGRDETSKTAVIPATGFTGAADTVYAVGILNARSCQAAAQVVSNKVAVRSVNPPAFTFVSPDTAVNEGTRLTLRAEATAADGSAPDILWYDSEEFNLSTTGTLRVVVNKAETYTVYAQQKETAQVLPQCISKQNVKVSLAGSSNPQTPQPCIPVRLQQLSPLASDTALCPGREVTVRFALYPDSAQIRVNSPLSTVTASEEDIIENGVRTGRIYSYTYIADGLAVIGAEGFVPRGGGKVPDSCIEKILLKISPYAVTVGKPSVEVSAGKDMVCGEEAVSYTAAVQHCDSWTWYANGDSVAGSENDLWHTPRNTGLQHAADSVWVVGRRAASQCAPQEETVSNVVKVRRVEMPEFTYVSPSVTVFPDTVLSLRVTALTYDSSAQIYWFDPDDNMVSDHSDLVMRIYESVEFLVEAVYGECLADTTVNVTVRIKPDPSDIDTSFHDIYIPNTVIPSSVRDADRYLSVYGEGINEVHLQVFDPSGVKVFESKDYPRNVRWNGTDPKGNKCPPGIYTYRVKAFMYNGTTQDRRGWVSVVR